MAKLRTKTKLKQYKYALKYTEIIFIANTFRLFWSKIDNKPMQRKYCTAA